MDFLEEREIGIATLNRSITVRATEKYLFEHCIELHFRFDGYGDESYNYITRLPIAQYMSMKNCGEINSGTSFEEYVARCCYSYVERSEIGEDVRFDDIYKVVKDCLKYYVFEK